MKVVPSDKTLRSIVIPGELRPEEWNKFRYILLELWHTSNPSLQEIINGYISICRFEVAKSYYHRQLSEYCHEKGIDITDITANQKAKFLKSSLKGYRDALSDLTAVSDGEWSSITDKLTKDLLTPEAGGNRGCRARQKCIRKPRWMQCQPSAQRVERGLPSLQNSDRLLRYHAARRISFQPAGNGSTGCSAVAEDRRLESTRKLVSSDM